MPTRSPKRPPERTACHRTSRRRRKNTDFGLGKVEETLDAQGFLMEFDGFYSILNVDFNGFQWIFNVDIFMEFNGF